MTKYEKLLAEYDGTLDISEHKMKNKGLYSDDCIWINKGLSEREKVCVLAEEIGHYHTSSGNILNQNDIRNAKQEHAARIWAYNKLVPESEIWYAIEEGYTEIYEIAEFLDVDEQFLKESIEHYKKF